MLLDQPEALNSMEIGPIESPIPMKQKNKKGLRVVLFPLPLQGHVNPMFQLANILHANGFSISIVHTNYNFPDTSKYPLFTFHEISDGLSESERGSKDEDIVALLWKLNTNCVEPLRECLASLLKSPAEEEEEGEVVSCLISDAIWGFLQGVADGFGLPRLVLRTSSLSSFLGFAAFPFLKEKGYLPTTPDLEHAETPIEELPPLRVKDIPSIKTSNPDIFYGLVCQMVNQMKTCSGIIWNSFEELEQSPLSKLGNDFPVPMFLIGPFHRYVPSSSSSLLAQDRSCLSWLDTQSPNSVLYVSFGSIACITRSEFLELAWGLANSNQPFIWVIRPGLVVGLDRPDLLPDGFEETIRGRGCIVQWAPQQEVLAHEATGGFWTHNGWNSTLESICEGVPMICMPNFGDQLVNSRYVSDVWKVGIHLDGELERGKIEGAVRRLMEKEEGKQLRERVNHLKEKLDISLRPGGSSFKNLESLTNYLSSVK